MLLDITVLGDPVVKARPRLGRNGTTYTPKHTRDAENVIAGAARRVFDRDPVDCPVGVAVEFHCATRRRSDGDNMLKMVTDALNKIVYQDDVQIEECFFRVHRGVGPEFASTHISVYELS